MQDLNRENRERLVEAAIRDAIHPTDPDLYTGFLQNLLQNPDFRADGPKGTVVLPEEAESILPEFCYLLQQPIFKRSIPQRRTLTGLVVASLLGRTQWTNTSGIKRFFLNGLKVTNVSMHVRHIREHLAQCNEAPRATLVRIEIPKSEALHTGYQLIFHDVGGKTLSEISMDEPAAEVRVRVYTRRAYNQHIARAMARGVDVNVFARTGQCVLDKDFSWSIIAGSLQSASLSISLLDPVHAADAKERDLIERHRQRLQQKSSRLANPLVSVVVVFHAGIAHGLELTQVGQEALLAGCSKGGSRVFWEIRPSCPLFPLFHELLPGPAQNTAGARPRMVIQT